MKAWSGRNRTVIDAHVHLHPNAATQLLRIMETNHLSGVINLARFRDERAADGSPDFPIQRRWKVGAIDLPSEVLEKLYHTNAQRLIPGLGKC